MKKLKLAHDFRNEVLTKLFNENSSLSRVEKYHLSKKIKVTSFDSGTVFLEIFNEDDDDIALFEFYEDNSIENVIKGFVKLEEDEAKTEVIALLTKEIYWNNDKLIAKK